MDCVLLWEETEKNERVERKMIRNKSNVMSLSEKSFVQNFRLSKESFKYVLDSISGELKTPRRSTGIPEIVKLAATLKFLAQGGYQQQIGQDHHTGLAQQTVSRCMFEVCKAIEKVLCPKHITFGMTSEEKNEAKRAFYSVSGIPGVIGVVDGTHIQMIRPAVNEHLYFNKKLKHSINAMVICDHKMMIKAVNGRFAGACHDSHVWNLSSERQYLQTNYMNGVRGIRILGDSGYPLEPWLLTPYRNAPENSAQSYYNYKFSKARSFIERVFGVLKARFRCLLAARELHYAPEKVVQILNVCCALHNICTLFNVESPANIAIEVEEVDASYTETIGNANETNIAKRLRDQIKNSMTT
ncbi:putative nuclease HARBI1 [Bactrocera dorsalis]|uniref:Nuclease HARBI1 n=1 Tax=Bactrocera dorsalis TaxID=27457 RepID=A0ABM3IY69_BACDO|nr:putative nuclease HARBI1 [Bactrocera dorsalis]